MQGLHYWVLIILINIITINSFALQMPVKVKCKNCAQIQKLKSQVEINFKNLKAHRDFINAFNINDPLLEQQYMIWTKLHPKIYTIPFVIGEAYLDQKSPKCIPFLQRAIIIKPIIARTWYLLSIYARFTNSTQIERDYLQKAMLYDPVNAEYAYYYAYSFKDSNPIAYDSLSLVVARKFRKSEESTMALYWLAIYSKIQVEKIAYFNQIFSRKEDQLTDTYLYAMLSYFDLLLRIDPNRAFKLALTMVLESKRNLNLWKERIKVAKAFLEAKDLLVSNKPGQAMDILNRVELGSIIAGNKINANEALVLFKATAADAFNQTTIAYNSVLGLYAILPTDTLKAALFKYGNKLGLDSNEVSKEVWKIRDSTAKPASDFCLDGYLINKKYSLSDFSGKIILLTYWEPACFSCKVQLVESEQIIKKFDTTKVSHVVLNINPSQDIFVIPFIKAGKFNFISLRDNLIRGKGSLTVLGLLTYCLIDQKGRVIFSNFRVNTDNQRTLELMIKETLAAKEY